MIFAFVFFFSFDTAFSRKLYIQSCRLPFSLSSFVFCSVRGYQNPPSFIVFMVSSDEEKGLLAPFVSEWTNEFSSTEILVIIVDSTFKVCALFLLLLLLVALQTLHFSPKAFCIFLPLHSFLQPSRVFHFSIPCFIRLWKLESGWEQRYVLTNNYQRTNIFARRQTIHYIHHVQISPQTCAFEMTVFIT